MTSDPFDLGSIPEETTARSSSELSTSERAMGAMHAPWLEGLNLPDLPVRFHEQVVEYLDLFRIRGWGFNDEKAQVVYVHDIDGADRTLTLETRDGAGTHDTGHDTTGHPIGSCRSDAPKASFILSSSV